MAFFMIAIDVKEIKRPVLSKIALTVGICKVDKHEHFFAVSEGEDKIIRINDDCDPAFAKKQFEKAYQFSENNRSKILLAPFRLVYKNMTILTLSKLLAHNIS